MATKIRTLSGIDERCAVGSKVSLGRPTFVLSGAVTVGSVRTGSVDWKGLIEGTKAHEAVELVVGLIPVCPWKEEMCFQGRFGTEGSSTDWVMIRSVKDGGLVLTCGRVEHEGSEEDSNGEIARQEAGKGGVVRKNAGKELERLRHAIRCRMMEVITSCLVPVDMAQAGMTVGAKDVLLL